LADYFWGIFGALPCRLKIGVIHQAKAFRLSSGVSSYFLLRFKLIKQFFHQVSSNLIFYWVLAFTLRFSVLAWMIVIVLRIFFSIFQICFTFLYSKVSLRASQFHFSIIFLTVSLFKMSDIYFERIREIHRDNVTRWNKKL
jgi:hypothetical protein